jgi:hypothetical protein
MIANLLSQQQHQQHQQSLVALNSPARRMMLQLCASTHSIF